MTPGNTSSDPFFGPLLNNVDHSNWIVTFGDASPASMTVGPKTGPTQTYIPTQSNPDTTAGTVYQVPPNSGSIGAPTSGGSPSVGGGMPTQTMLLMLGGAAALILLWKH